jgi:hypothetical protein
MGVYKIVNLVTYLSLEYNDVYYVQYISKIVIVAIIHKPVYNVSHIHIYQMGNALQYALMAHSHLLVYQFLLW